MTGGEIVPAAKIAAAVAKKALSDADDQAMLQELAAESPRMRAAAESYARRTAVKQAVLLRLYQPLARFLGVSRTYFDTDFHSDMAEKLACIPDEHLSTPSASVAIPAMEGLRYSVDEPALKEMYLNLLATATDARTQETAHPSFAEIIRQLSPREAPMLLDCLRQVHTLVRLRRKSEDGRGETPAANHLMYFTNAETWEQVEEPSLPVWIDNWARLGLVDASYTRSLTDKSRYDWVETSPQYMRLAELDPRGGESLRIAQGLLGPSDFGAQFRSAVSFDGVPMTGAPGVRPERSDQASPTSPTAAAELPIIAG
ncbi:DUF4393 domain-containing protein [Kribbella sp. NPDC051620]|uniref:DUF4393 domain-containing protein n=1 Tax=Kribbella sp. NPDC051620 TaxID=3364120 RepID=UPI0037BD422C